jgi:hypothetical protein
MSQQKISRGKMTKLFEWLAAKKIEKKLCEKEIETKPCIKSFIY